MSSNIFYKQLFSNKNLYFIASFIVLVTATILLLILLKGQTADNLQAKLLSESSKELSQVVTKKQMQVEEKVLAAKSIPDVGEVIDPKESISEVTRYLDEVFVNFPGEFVNTSLTFSELREAEGLAYSEVNLNITSTEENFYNFLNFVENTGFTSAAETRLMEIRSINMTLSSANEEDSLNYRVVMRIYFQSQTAEEEIQTDENTSSINPFSNQ
jgi:hypothetical protein